MNRISKELKQEIEKKVGIAFGKPDENELRKLTLHYKPALRALAKQKQEYDTAMQVIKDELAKKGIYLNSYREDFELEVRNREREQQAVDIINKIVIRLQYSQDPNFLSSIDTMISEMVPKKESVIKA